MKEQKMSRILLCVIAVAGLAAAAPDGSTKNDASQANVASKGATNSTSSSNSTNSTNSTASANSTVPVDSAISATQPSIGSTQAVVNAQSSGSGSTGKAFVASSFFINNFDYNSDGNGLLIVSLAAQAAEGVVFKNFVGLSASQDRTSFYHFNASVPPSTTFQVNIPCSVAATGGLFTSNGTALVCDSGKQGNKCNDERRENFTISFTLPKTCKLSISLDKRVVNASVTDPSAGSLMKLFAVNPWLFVLDSTFLAQSQLMIRVKSVSISDGSDRSVDVDPSCWNKKVVAKDVKFGNVSFSVLPKTMSDGTVRSYSGLPAGYQFKCSGSDDTMDAFLLKNQVASYKFVFGFDFTPTNTYARRSTDGTSSGAVVLNVTVDTTQYVGPVITKDIAEKSHSGRAEISFLLSVLLVTAVLWA
ncbi:hypothetical protein BJ741DRAFT_634405 [Chytriomyces cf. hyalinus JEL632]|nr:hypothetical protein BJ741DRAFT_634405 [Chytriomyces cf. hyalinus JEL632]